MKKEIFLFLSISLFILIRCSDDDGVALFSGITETDEFANLFGSIDETDWVLDEVWTSQESQLFEGVSENSLNNNGSTVDFSLFPSTLRQVPAYPNPNRGSFSFSLLDTDFTEGEFVIVDNSYNIVIGPISLNAGSSRLSFEIEVKNQTASIFQGTAPTGPTPSVSSGQILRVYYYYRMAENNIYLKGHGDILFQ